MTPPGFVVLGIRRAFYANPARELTTRELWSWTHPREVRCPDRFRRKNNPRRRRAVVRPGWSALASRHSVEIARATARGARRARTD
jgi:hypothetical protein